MPPPALRIQTSLYGDDDDDSAIHYVCTYTRFDRASRPVLCWSTNTCASSDYITLNNKNTYILRFRV